MQALILAGGYATRLYPLTKDTPKPLLPIQDKPLIDYLLDKMIPIKDLSSVIVVTNDKFYSPFRTWAQGHKDFPVEIQVINDETKTNEDRRGSIGDCDFVLKKGLIQEDLLVIGGDNLFDQDLKGFLRWARQKSPAIAAGLFDIQDKAKATQFGVATLDQQKKVSSFEEKPRIAQTSLIGMCLYFFPKPALGRIGEYLKESKKSDTTGDFIKWLSQKEPVYGFVFTGKWYDIGSLEAYQEAEERF